MCGIVGGVCKKNIAPFLIKGLKHLEYRGYDSAGLVINHLNKLERYRSTGKVSNLENKISGLDYDLNGLSGIAHTRWATHGAPTEKNAHPHICNNQIAVVQNGIIENFQSLKEEQIRLGYEFTSDTDTEVIAHCIFESLKSSNNLLEATQKSIKKFKGSFALAVIDKDNPDVVVISKRAAPMVVGLSARGTFFASDKLALIDITSKFISLEDGDTALVSEKGIEIFNTENQLITRQINESTLKSGQVDKGDFDHFMLKEIFEQPQAIRDTLESRISHNEIYVESFGHLAESIFRETEHIKIIACGTSYNAGIVAKLWLEDIAKISSSVEIASEYRYRNSITPDKTLFVTISQSGETADTLEALKNAKLKNPGCPTLTICNSPESSLTRESDLVFLTHAGPEIGVASTKAFTTQLVSLGLLTSVMAKVKNTITKQQEEIIANGLNRLPGLIEDALTHEADIEEIAKEFEGKFNALFLGRGTMYAVAMEGALKLKEISYIHSEAFPAGELKHGPIALIDENTPVIVVAPKDELLEKLNSNLNEVKSRGSVMYVFKDELADIPQQDNMKIIPITKGLGRITGPIIFTIPLQLLSYHVAKIKGCNIDQPRNLAKSVTVE